MATSIFTDCSSMQGSTTSSSSDMLTLTTAASSWCAIPACTRIRIVRLLRPHTRRILVTPGTVPSYGFAVRGGKEFSTGFFVSSVDRNSEAEQKGLRIGDQILRINGFRIDDAIHKEFVQLISHQERLTLKVRSVGMLPAKDKENDCLTWNVVKAPSISSTPSECSYQSSERTERHNRNQGERVINVVLNVAPRTKLGLGICKGPEWKPGIFVQFTKEKSVAREAGLRPGDQILTVNSIDFSDVLFSEAVAVMKSSNKLDMTVHTGAGCDLFPGESSGYNSSASSVTGDQSPCWADVKSKRLTAVREETTTGTAPQQANWTQPLYANERKYRSKSHSTATNLPIRQTSFSSSLSTSTTSNETGNKEINKTIIKLSESGTSINNTFVANHPQSSATGTVRRTLKTSLKENPHHHKTEREREGEKEKERERCMGSGGGTLTKLNQHSLPTSNNIPPPPPPIGMLNEQHQQIIYSAESTSASSSSSSSNNTYTKNMLRDDVDDGEIRIGGVAATMQRYQYANIQMAKQNNSGTMASSEIPSYSAMSMNLETEHMKGNSYDGGSLSSAITEELKKRKAKRHPHNSYKEHTPQNDLKASLQYESKREATINHNSTNANASNGNDHKIVSNNSSNSLNMVGDQHSALMNEFKQAHKRMFKNGFKENGEPIENKDRQEALMNTTILDDTGTCRSKGTKHNAIQPAQNDTVDSCREQQQHDTYSHIPKPPPPQMTNKNKTLQQTCVPTNTTKSSYTNDHHNHPNVGLRLSNNSQSNGGHINDLYSRSSKTISLRNTCSNSIASNNNPSSSSQTNRHTLRLGTVTIGEYRNNNTMRREPEKFDFISTQNRGIDSGETTPTNETLQSELQNTLSRANLKKSSGGGNSYLEHQRNCPLHQQQQQQQHHLQQQHQSVDYGNNNGYNVEEITKKLQKSSINDKNTTAELLTKTNNHRPNINAGSSGVGILKNGNRNNTNSSSKSTEKSIKFG